MPILLKELYRMVCDWNYEIKYLGCSGNIYYFEFCGIHITHNVKLTPLGTTLGWYEEEIQCLMN